jgi:YVTN family beta-propeller protein
MMGWMAAVLLAASAVDPTLLVLNKAEDTVWLVNMRTGEARAKVGTGPNPNEVAVSPNGKLAAISNMGTGGRPPGTTITLVDVSKGVATRTLDISPHGAPHGILWLDDDRILFTSHASDTVNVASLKEGKIIRSIPTQQKGTHLALATRDRKTVYAVNAGSGTVSVIDFTAGKVVQQIAAGARAEGISLSPDEKLLACGNVGANSVSIIETRTRKVIRTLEGIPGPIRTAFSRDGKHLLVSAVGKGAVEVFQVKDWTPKASVDLKAKPVANPAYGSQWPVPMNFVVRKDGSILVVLVTSHAVAQINPRTWSVDRWFPTGGLPDGIAVSGG